MWPIEEKPVEKGTVPGEWYSPTQPIPTKPKAYARNGVTVDDLIDFTPELRNQALQITEHYKIGPIFTPPVVHTDDAARHAHAGHQRRRHQLAGRLVRSRDAHLLCAGLQRLPEGDGPLQTQAGSVGYELRGGHMAAARSWMCRDCR